MTRQPIYIYVFVLSLLVSVIQLFFATTLDFTSPITSWSFGITSHHHPRSMTMTIAAAATTTTTTVAGSTSSSSSSSRPPRILLGIFSNIDTDETLMNSDGRLRETHRTTHLIFDHVHNTTTPNRVCSIQKFSIKPVDEWKPYECQLVYTFVLGANETRSETPPSEWRANLVPSSTANSNNDVTITPSQEALEQMTLSEHDKGDFLFLNTGDRHNSYKVWSWHRYVANQWMKKKDKKKEQQSVFDYVAHMDARVRIHPVEFWQNSIFTSSPKKRIYAGNLVHKSKCSQKKSVTAEWCPSLQAPTMLQRISLISGDLLDSVVQADPVETYGALQPKESVDVALANFLQQLISVPVTPQALVGARPALANRGGWSDYLHQWDKYKDTMLTAEGSFNDPKEVALVEASSATKYFSVKTSAKQLPGPRILMGIFTMDSPVETERRATLRSTYLSYYKYSPTPNRICSLHELLSGLVPNNGVDCQMAYTFVMGSNPNGPTELIGPNATFPMIADNQAGSSSRPLLQDENDIVHLNIRENMEDGKSPTWFKYATTVIDDHFYFDYVGKTDTDTLIFPNFFLDTTLAKSPVFPDNVRVYGGQYRQKYEWSHRRVGPIYMGGHLYWMSVDLARFVTSPELDRRAVDWGIEDFSMGNFVHSHPLPIRRIPVIGNRSHRHPLKELDEFRKEWARFQKEEKSAAKRPD